MTRTEMLELIPKGLIVAELGVFTGDFSKDIIEVCKPSKMYLVDCFDGIWESGDKDGNNSRTLDLTPEYDRLKKLYKNDNVEVLKTTAIDFLRGNKIDAVYIDTEHSYKETLEQLELSLRCKYIMGHDYHMEGVKKAVDEFCDKYSLKINLLTDDKCPSYLICV